MSESKWDQSVFDQTIKDYLMEHESSTWPKHLNKRAYFVDKRAIELSPRVEPAAITAGLSKEVWSRQGGGPARQVQLGYALAAKRASKDWSKSSRFLTASKRAFIHDAPEMLAAAWEAQIQAKRNQLEAQRRNSAGFMRLGWLNSMMELGPSTGLSYYPSVGLAARLRGMFKGRAEPATPGRLMVTVSNTAHAQSETKGGFERIGQPALEAAMAAEQAELQRHMEEDMEPGIRDFNSKQH